MTRIFLSPPHMSGGELARIHEAFATNWIAPVGPHVDAFEREFAELVGVPHAAALSSGTAALHLAVKLAGVRPGDEVLSSDLTFCATANAVLYEGGVPVFIDADRKTWTLDPELLREELAACALRGAVPRAVVVADLYGQAADYGAILGICGEYGVAVIEDAAEALGATCHSRAAGTFGAFGVFSFNGNKIITTSGGGMLTSEDGEAIERARFLATQARDPAPHYEHSTVGYNYRLSNVLAAIGREQLRVLDDRVDARRRNFEFYRQALGDLPGVAFMPEAPYGRSTRWLTCLTIDPALFGATRDSVRLALDREDIEARPVWKPMHLQPVFRGMRVRGGGVSEDLFERGLCLPSGSALSASDLERIASLVCRQCPAAGGGRRPVLHASPPRERTSAGIQQIHDLLSRPSARLDHTAVESFLAGKRVLVTGAGGSIGSELVRQATRYHPSTLLLVERSEPALFSVEMSLGRMRLDLPVRALLADVGDERRMRSIFEAERPEVVLHAAAHKHVPMMEANPAEAIKNNVLASRLLGELAGELGAEAFVLISTDKAIRPASVMGASKRLAEVAVQDLDRRFRGTRYLAVRFGNVLGSAGSVIPIFREQIERGGPVTVTHPEVTRYFMTLTEAVALVLEAGAVGRGGEIMILDMGKPVKILDLAAQMIRLAGLRPFEDVPIVFIGLRPGEKLHEDLDLELEQIARTRNPRIFSSRLPPPPADEIGEALARLADLAADGDGERIRTSLNELIPDSQLGGRTPAEEPRMAGAARRSARP